MSNIFLPHLTHSNQSAHAGEKSILEASKIPGAREKCVFGRGKLEIGQIRSTRLRSGMRPGQVKQCSCSQDALPLLLSVTFSHQR